MSGCHPFIFGGHCYGSGSVPPTPPTITNCLYFDGVNDYATCAPLIQNYADFSVSFWFQLQDISVAQELFCFLPTSGGRDPLTVYYQADFIYCLASGSAWSFTQKLAWTGDTNWHHFTFTYNSTSFVKEVFIDGVSIGTLGIEITLPFDTFNIGRAYNGSRYGFIKMADVGLHDTVLTQQEITAMQTLGVASGHEVQRYPFIEAAGTTTGAIEDVVSGQTMQLRNMTSPYGIINETP